jgi:hypothetical protein
MCWLVPKQEAPDARIAPGLQGVMRYFAPQERLGRGLELRCVSAALQPNQARLGRFQKGESPGQATGCRVKLLGAQLERFNRGQWLGDCRGLVMPPTPSD